MIFAFSLIESGCFIFNLSIYFTHYMEQKKKKWYIFKANEIYKIFKIHFKNNKNVVMDIHSNIIIHTAENKSIKHLL